MQSFTYSHFPEHLSTVHVALFSNVSNTAQLKQRLVSAATMPGPEGEQERAAVNFAFIDARLICSFLHLQTAIYQAILADVQGALRTRTVHSEVLWALSPSTNITDAIRRYGISETTTSLILVRIGSPNDTTVEKQMTDVVHGSISSLDLLQDIADWSLIRKYHKIPAPAPKDQHGEETLKKTRELVVSLVACKGVLA
ncbi:CGI-121-domain-containing protein [Cristinia sonorae]|uniref:EKC/KEOPS complex subunit CGI121 n=1 Tax=Cristinia sonorae TaxID=1940300 RepID=A0A8K0UXQ1_9AGAR|nr:CGI-121-domain-containing protein [Cristinia sonorae]